MATAQTENIRELVRRIESQLFEEEVASDQQERLLAMAYKQVDDLTLENQRLKQGKKIYWKGIGRVVALCESATDDSEKITIEIENLAWWGEVNADAPVPTTELVVPSGTHRLGQKVPFEGCKLL